MIIIKLIYNFIVNQRLLQLIRKIRLIGHLKLVDIREFGERFLGVKQIDF